MKRAFVRTFVATLSAACFLRFGVPLGAQTAYQPVAPWIAGAGPAVEQHNFWQHSMPMMFRTHQQMLAYRSLELKADVAVVAAALNDTVQAQPDFTADTSVDVEGALAAGLVKSGAAGPADKLAAYLRERYAAYAKAAQRDGVPADSLTSACGYLVDAAYEARADVKPAAATRRDVRGACVLIVARAQALGGLGENKARYGWAHVYADMGGLFLD